MASLAERLRELRSERKLRQREVAQYLGITESAYGYYEQGRREPSYEALGALAELYGVSIDSLFGRVGERKERTPKPLPTIGDRIRTARERMKLTSVEAAKKLELPESMVLSHELGKSPVSEHDMQHYARTYKIPVSYLNGTASGPEYDRFDVEAGVQARRRFGLSCEESKFGDRPSLVYWEPLYLGLEMQNTNNPTELDYPDMALVPVVQRRGGVDRIVGEKYIPLTEVIGHEPFFCLIVGDNCMSNEGIRKGMQALIQMAGADEGKIAAVVVDGQITLRRLFFRDDTVTLVASDAVTPVIILSRSECNIKGQVKQITWKL